MTTSCWLTKAQIDILFSWTYEIWKDLDETRYNCMSIVGSLYDVSEFSSVLPASKLSLSVLSTSNMKFYSLI